MTAVSPEVALNRNLGDLVADTLNATAGNSEHTAKAYQTAIGLFLAFLSVQIGEHLPEDWIPLAEPLQEGKRTVWQFRGRCAALVAIRPSLVEGFVNHRKAEGDSKATAGLRGQGVRTFLRVALRDNIITQEQGLALGITPYKQRQRRDVQPVGRRLKPDEVVKVHDCLFKSLKSWAEVVGVELGVEADRFFCSVNKGDKLTSGKMSGGVIGRLVAEYGYHAELAPFKGDNRLSPHDLRRTMARNAYDNGAGLIIVQQVLGHADPKTTARYIGAYEDDDNTAVDYVRY